MAELSNQTTNSQSNFFEQYHFSWEILDVFLEGNSALDIYSFMGQLRGEENVASFLSGYGFNLDNPVLRAELFGTYQEALQFIKRYFLKEGNIDGLDLAMPPEFNLITDVNQLFLLATREHTEVDKIEISLWAGVVLKVMHTFLHADKDLRHRYFSAIQTQIFDRFYKIINRDNNNNLFLGDEHSHYKVPLKEFVTKSKKSRESIIIKLLHKKENVAEELFDRIGMRIITHTKFDCMRVIKFLTDHFILVPHNIKPSRCINTLFDIKKLETSLKALYKTAKKESWDEARYLKEANIVCENSAPENSGQKMDNQHSFKGYKAIHFTSRQLIRYTNPFMREFNKVKKWAKENGENEASSMILKLDTSTISRDLMFFYPFEVQITNYESYIQNTEGEASHKEYKSQQVKTAIRRLFLPLLKLKNIEF